MALEGYAQLLDQRDAADLSLVVTAIDPFGGSEVVAAAHQLHIATAAVTAAAVAHPKARIVLRQGVRAMLEQPTGASTDRAKADE
jgi:hypothetical protein